MTAQDAIHALWTASLATPMDLKTSGARDIAVALNLSLACIFALYPKTKSYRWHLCEAHFQGAHDVRPYSHKTRDNICIAMNPGPHWTNNQGD